jgi:hypothetical protein
MTGVDFPVALPAVEFYSSTADRQPSQSRRKGPVIGKAAQIGDSVPISLCRFDLGLQVGIGPQALGASPRLEHRRLEGVKSTATGSPLPFDFSSEVAKSWDRYLFPTRDGKHGRDVAGVDPAIQRGMADPEKACGEIARHGAAEVAFEFLADLSDRRVDDVVLGFA